MFNNTERDGETERERELELNFGVCVLSGTYVAELWLPSGNQIWQWKMDCLSGICVLRLSLIGDFPLPCLITKWYYLSYHTFNRSNTPKTYCKTVLQHMRFDTWKIVKASNIKYGLHGSLVMTQWPGTALWLRSSEGERKNLESWRSDPLFYPGNDSHSHIAT